MRTPLVAHSLQRFPHGIEAIIWSVELLAYPQQLGINPCDVRGCIAHAVFGENVGKNFSVRR